MKNSFSKFINFILRISAFAGIISLFGCRQFSEHYPDDSAGVNGGFEISQSNLPVNWLLYTAKTTQEGDFDLILDTENYQEGKQSLQFKVRECSPSGGRLSPGLAQEFPALPGKRYTISYWIMNQGCEFQATVGAVGPKTGAPVDKKTSKEDVATWKKMEHTYQMPAEYPRLRFELTILQPGSFWIDNFRMEELPD